MKLQKLFENNSLNLKPIDKLNKAEIQSWDWIIREYMESSKIIKREFQESKLSSPYEFFFANQDLFINDDPHGYLRNLRVSDGLVSSSGVFEIYKLTRQSNIGEPPFKIGTVKGEFELATDLHFDKIPNWFPSNCESISLEMSNLESFSGISKIVKGCKRLSLHTNLTRNFNTPVKKNNLNDDLTRVPKNLIELLLIPNLTKLKLTSDSTAHSETSNWKNAEAIMLKHLQGERDIFDCQEDLINAGLVEQAKL